MMIFHSEKLPEGRSNSISDVFALSDHLGGTAQEPQEPWPLICWPSSSCQGERWNLSAPVERWRCWHSFDHMMWSPMVGFTVWLVYLWMKPTKYIYIYILDVYVTYWAMLIVVLVKSVFVLLYPMLAATRYVPDFPFLYMNTLTLQKWWTYTRNRFSSPIYGSIEAWYWLYTPIIYTYIYIYVYVSRCVICVMFVD